MSLPLNLSSDASEAMALDVGECGPRVHWRDALCNAERLLPAISQVLGTDELKMNETMALVAHIVTNFCLIKTIKTYCGAYFHLGIEMEGEAGLKISIEHMEMEVYPEEAVGSCLYYFSHPYNTCKQPIRGRVRVKHLVGTKQEWHRNSLGLCESHSFELMNGLSTKSELLLSQYVDTGYIRNYLDIPFGKTSQVRLNADVQTKYLRLVIPESCINMHILEHTLATVGDEEISKVMDPYMLRNTFRIVSNGPPPCRREKEITNKCIERMNQYYYGVSVEEAQLEETKSSITLHSSMGIKAITLGVEQVKNLSDTIRKPSEIWFQPKAYSVQDETVRRHEEEEEQYNVIHNPESRRILWCKRTLVFEEGADTVWTRNETIGVVFLDKLLEVALGHGFQMCQCQRRAPMFISALPRKEDPFPLWRAICYATIANLVRVQAVLRREFEDTLPADLRHTALYVLVEFVCHCCQKVGRIVSPIREPAKILRKHPQQYVVSENRTIVARKIGPVVLEVNTDWPIEAAKLIFLSQGENQTCIDLKRSTVKLQELHTEGISIYQLITPGERIKFPTHCGSNPRTVLPTFVNLRSTTANHIEIMKEWRKECEELREMSGSPVKSKDDIPRVTGVLWETSMSELSDPRAMLVGADAKWTPVTTALRSLMKVCQGGGAPPYFITIGGPTHLCAGHLRTQIAAWKATPCEQLRWQNSNDMSMEQYRDMTRSLWEIATIRATFCPINRIGGVHYCYYPNFTRIVEIQFDQSGTYFCENLTKFENKLWSELAHESILTKDINWSKTTIVRGIRPNRVVQTFSIYGPGMEVDDYGAVRRTAVRYKVTQARPITTLDVDFLIKNLELENNSASVAMDRMRDVSSTN